MAYSGHVGFGISAQQTDNLGETLRELNSPDKSLHYLFYDDAPPYTGPTQIEALEQLPKKKVVTRRRLWQYRGGAAIVAAPGDVLPKVYGTTIVQGRVIWASEPYLDENGRSRIDVAYGICQGDITGLLRIYGGNDKQLLWGHDTLSGAANGVKYWKGFKVYTGSLEQEASNVIVDYEGVDSTPYYRGLCYVVFKGLKLYKFNKTAPDLWFVVGRGIEAGDDDEYADDPTFYNPPSAYPVTSIAGDFNALPDTLFVTYSGGHVYQVTLSTNTWTVISNTSNMGNDTIKQFNALVWFKGSLYCQTRRGLHRYNGTPFDWTTVVGTGGFTTAQGSIRANDDYFITWYTTDPITAEVFTYDGSTSINTGYNALSGYSGHGGSIDIDPDTGDIYAIFYKTIDDSSIMKYVDGVGWARGTDVNANVVNSKRLIRQGGRSFNSGTSLSPTFEHYINNSSWVQYPAAPGPASVYTIYDDTAFRVTCLEYFSSRWHMTRSEIGGTQYLYRLESDLTTVTAMPTPIAAAAYYTHMVQRVNNRCFVGCSRGFWEAGDA